jgi:predicted secreted Zn-dependent protease
MNLTSERELDILLVNSARVVGARAMVHHMYGALIGMQGDRDPSCEEHKVEDIWDLSEQNVSQVHKDIAFWKMKLEKAKCDLVASILKVGLLMRVR